MFSAASKGSIGKKSVAKLVLDIERNLDLRVFYVLSTKKEKIYATLSVLEKLKK